MAVLVAGGRAVEGPQPRGDVSHGRAEGDELDLAEHGRDLHRDVLDVVTGEQREVRLETAGGLRFTEDCLAELVQVQPEPGLAPSLDVAAEVFLLARQDDVLRLVTQPAHDGRHDQAREIVGHRATQLERDPLPPVHVLRDAVSLEEVGELVGDALGAMAPEGLIREGDGQLLAVWIGHHPREFPGLCALLGRLPRSRVVEQRLGQLDGALGETPLPRW